MHQVLSVVPALRTPFNPCARERRRCTGEGTRAAQPEDVGEYVAVDVEGDGDEDAETAQYTDHLFNNEVRSTARAGAPRRCCAWGSVRRAAAAGGRG